MDVAFQMFIAIGLPTGLVALLFWFRHVERLKVLDVVDASAERQQPLSAEVIRALPGTRTRPPNADLRRGVLLVAIGVSLILIGICVLVGIATTPGGQGAVAAGVGVAGTGAIPLCVGLALVILSRVDRSTVA